MEVVVSIENFEDGEFPREINSPRTLEACLRAGLDPAELAPKPRSFFVSKHFTKEMIDVKHENFDKKRMDKIALVKNERNAIIRYAERQKTKTSTPHNDGGALNVSGGAGGLVEQEEMRMEALKRRQEKELSKLIEREQTGAALQLKIKRAEEEEHRKKKAHEQKVAQQKAAAEKKLAQRQLELKQQEDEEAAKKREMDKKEAEFERKRQKAAIENEKRILAEARQREVERAEKLEQNRLKTEALIQQQVDEAERNRVIMLERENRVKEQIEEKKKKKREDTERAKEEAEKRIDEALHKHHELHAQKKIEFDERQKQAEHRAHENEVLEREKLKKQAEDREKRNKLRLDRLVEAYNQRSQTRKAIIDRRVEKDKVFEKIQTEREKEISMMKFSAEVTFTEKLENVERVARVNEFHRLQTLRRIEEQDARYNEIQERKKELYKAHLEEIKLSISRKHEITEAMHTMRTTNDFSGLDKLFSKKNKKDKRGNKGATGGGGGDDGPEEAGDGRLHTA